MERRERKGREKIERGEENKKSEYRERIERKGERKGETERGSVHNMVISGFQAIRQARARVERLEPATEGSPQMSVRIRYPLCYGHPRTVQSC
ncbi:hypothetical protein PoB_007083900 [Plakobranchus ocellatus]|uniref:Uncharacterized protein n=1 Tax=Plakobranchus ocellatus TaxID=259542 RepID=A0AAV4DJG9_9GAST|nr:hypothetical protein PoB_007083900 [Plakobranchus ocellatus]